MKGQLLIVDDERDILVALRGLFGKEGYDVETAESGEEALAKARSGLFHVVITDLSMKGMSELDLLREIRRLDPESAVLMITAYGSQRIAVEAMKAGAEDYLPKPFDDDEARDPEAVYEAAISERVSRYQQLKAAAAGVIYMRGKFERELKAKSAELGEVTEQASQAADMNEDAIALVLIRRRHELEAECARLRDELAELTREVEDAKKSLLNFKGEIEKLKVEKVRMVARLRNAQARVRIQRAIEELSYDEDVRALEEVRESIQQTLSQAGAGRELQGAELAEKVEEIRRANTESKAMAELEELNLHRRPPLVPINAFVQKTSMPNGGSGAAQG